MLPAPLRKEDIAILSCCANPHSKDSYSAVDKNIQGLLFSVNIDINAKLKLTIQNIKYTVSVMG